MKKIALYGGSFDPIHIGHLTAAENLVRKLELDKLIFIPSNITPLKNSSLRATKEQRYKMIELSIKNKPYFEVSDYEITKEEISYTYYTVKHFKELYPESEIYFLIGTDRVKDLERWYNIEELAKLVTFVFAARDNESLAEIIEKDSFYNEIKYVILEAEVIEISSTEIREKIKNEENINYILAPECADYIKELKLYEF